MLLRKNENPRANAGVSSSCVSQWTFAWLRSASLFYQSCNPISTVSYSNLSILSITWLFSTSHLLEREGILHCP